MSTYFVGIDVGSSSVKTSIFDSESGQSMGSASFPPTEQAIHSPHPGWAEQDPQLWWDSFKAGYARIVRDTRIDTRKIEGIGIAYQMHGLVVLDKTGNVLRPAIIWCDSRAVEIGERAFRAIGRKKCLQTILNSPGNFTASKLQWVRLNEPDIYADVYRFMLPGDYIAYRLSGDMTTTAAGLSEGMLWNFQTRSVSEDVLTHTGLDKSLIPDLVPNMGFQGSVSDTVGTELGLKNGVKITYRAGDQPNNALSLNILHPGQVATTAGTSGVIYAVTDKNTFEERSRLNTFLHVNDSPVHPRNGILICVNGAGILYTWLKRLFNKGRAEVSYDQMNDWSGSAPIGSEGLMFFPFGNGAERLLENRQIHANLIGLDYNRHDASYLVRAGLEGVAFALNMGFELLKEADVSYRTVRAGRANLFLSPTFRSIFANTTQTTVELYETDGAEGAARGAALGASFYDNPEDAFASLVKLETIDPEKNLVDAYAEVYAGWKEQLDKL